MSNTAKKFDVLATSLSVLYNYFNSSTNFFSNLYPVKILDLLAKSIFSYTRKKEMLKFCEFWYTFFFFIFVEIDKQNSDTRCFHYK